LREEDLQSSLARQFLQRLIKRQARPDRKSVPWRLIRRRARETHEQHAEQDHADLSMRQKGCLPIN
jgi:hypothetical protein